MTKRTAIIGGSLFQDIIYENGCFIPTYMQAAVNLPKEFNIDNYSSRRMTSSRAKELISKIDMSNLYSQCILAIGEYDLDNPDLFKANLRYIIEDLQAKDIRVLLVSLPCELLYNPKAIIIQEILDNIAVQNNIDYIYDGKNDKIVSYTILEKNDLTNAIIELC